MTECANIGQHLEEGDAFTDIVVPTVAADGDEKAELAAAWKQYHREINTAVRSVYTFHLSREDFLNPAALRAYCHALHGALAVQGVPHEAAWALACHSGKAIFAAFAARPKEGTC